MAQQQTRGSRWAVNLVGVAILVAVPLTGGGQRAMATGSDYYDAHPAVQVPLVVGLVAFVVTAVGLQHVWGFAVSALLGAVLATGLFVGLYEPARWALPWFGPDRATCAAGQVADAAGTHCEPARKAAGR